MIKEWKIEPRETESVHSFVWRHYKGRGGTCRAIGENGNRLHENRIEADYKNEVDELDSLVEESFIFAEKILVWLNQIRNPTNKHT